ncbi:hypothetical protein GGX14DRAFT_403605 [Mycena pura]|uniref:Uncharacterized protein n=1 Tax=Mycena pura TaxID=153505 RepID=A0AAD6UVQ4_9AGAR|nr:hypothetical protein GGX14DRAFT_403605 [Mycena pura]
MSSLNPSAVSTPPTRRTLAGRAVDTDRPFFQLNLLIVVGDNERSDRATSVWWAGGQVQVMGEAHITVLICFLMWKGSDAALGVLFGVPLLYNYTVVPKAIKVHGSRSGNRGSCYRNTQFTQKMSEKHIIIYWLFPSPSSSEKLVRSSTSARTWREPEVGLRARAARREHEGPASGVALWERDEERRWMRRRREGNDFIIWPPGTPGVAYASLVKRPRAHVAARCVTVARGGLGALLRGLLSLAHAVAMSGSSTRWLTRTLERARRDERRRRVVARRLLGMGSKAAEWVDRCCCGRWRVVLLVGRSLSGSAGHVGEMRRDLRRRALRVLLAELVWSEWSPSDHDAEVGQGK